MKTLIVAAALTLAVPALAAGQDRGERGGRGPDGGQYQAGQPQAGQPAGEAGRGEFGRGGFGNRGPEAAPNGAPERRGGPGFGGGQYQRDGRGFGGRADERGAREARPSDGRQGYGGRADREGRDRRYDGRGYDGGRSDDGRYDRRGFTDNRPFDRERRYDGGRRYGGGYYSYRDRDFDRFRAQPYRWPGGYRGVFNWRPRQILPPAFRLRDYYIGDYWAYGFGAPPYGYEWIRVGDDALLVNVYTGEILEVALGVFYW